MILLDLLKSFVFSVISFRRLNRKVLMKVVRMFCVVVFFWSSVVVCGVVVVVVVLKFVMVIESEKVVMVSIEEVRILRICEIVFEFVLKVMRMGMKGVSNCVRMIESMVR